MWTNISKPSVTTYTNINPAGRVTYDDSTVLYDDPTVYYDGSIPGLWTDIAKPNNGTTVVRAGKATGLLAPPTYATSVVSINDPWTYISKPI